MCCSTLNTQTYNELSRRAVRVTALLLCVLYAAVFLNSISYVAAHLNHIHDHDGTGGACAVCVHIAASEKLLKQLSSAYAATAVISVGLFVTLILLKPMRPCLGLNTLISLKVRLNN